LLRINERTVLGSEEDVRSPAFQDTADDKILQGWLDQLDLKSLDPELADIEESNASKFGPRSQAKPWSERKDSVEAYFNKDEIREIRPSILRPRLTPKTLEAVLRYHLLNSSNSGLPDLKRKSLVKSEGYDSGRWWEELDKFPYAMLFTRTQEQRKTRPVWGFPMSATILEQMYFQPLLSVRKKARGRAALRGPDEVDLAITFLMDMARRSKAKLVCVDFSAFDSSVQTYLQAIAWDEIASYFQVDTWLEINYIARLFASIGIVTPDGILCGWHGVPSGSVFTNELDSYVQIAAAFDINDHTQFGDIRRYYEVQGDDGVYVDDNPDHLYANFEAHGLNLNQDKSFLGDQKAIYLQRYYSSSYLDNGVFVGVYSTVRALNRIVHLERWTDMERMGISGQDFFSLRTISILENCKHHPQFPELVKYVASFDKYSLKYSQSSVKAFAENTLRRSGGLFNQYSDMIGGINNFKTIKVLKETL
jgi:hypothetical protein